MIKIKKTIVRRERERERCIVLPIFRDTREPLGGKKGGGGGRGLGPREWVVLVCWRIRKREIERARERERERERERQRQRERER